MPSPRLTAEVWRRPGHGTFAKVIAEVPVINGSVTTIVNGIGEGRITVPKNYDRIDEILKPDIATPANNVSSLVRVFSESSTTPIFEFMPNLMSGEQDKADPDIELSGPAIDHVFGYARVEAWDWDGTDDHHSFWPDWIWGGKNILGDLTGTYNPATVRAWNDADDGTFTIGVNVDGGGVQTTSALYKGATASTVEAALIALSNVVDIDVSGSGTESSPWNIRSVDPEGEYVFTFSTGSLIGPRKVEVSGATGGTWTATIDGQTTAAIARNASAATVKAEYEALSTVTTVAITRGVTSTGVIWVAYFETPDSVTTFTVTDSLTPAGATVTASQPAPQFFTSGVTPGVTIPTGWTPSFNPVTNLPHGILEEFRITDFTGSDPAAPACDDLGLGIMFDAGAGGFLFPGIQKIVAVKPGGRYYATVTAYAQGASDTYRFVIRDLYENGIAVDPSFTTGTTLTANTWTTFFIPVVDIPTDVDRVIFRFASITGIDSPPTFLACIELREGMPPDTWGHIFEELHLDASTNHASRRVWQVGATAADYLSLDFTETVDSAGAAWADPEVSITLKRGQSYLRVQSECYKMGYEGRIVPNNVATGTWKFQLYNPGTMGTNHTGSSTGPSIQGGRDPSRRDLRRFLPPATDVAVEAGQQNIARSRNTNAVTALGRIEQYIPNQDLGTLVEAATAADFAVTTNLSRSQSLSYVLTPTQLDPEPLIAYKAADTLYVLDPPDVPTRDARRIKTLGATWTKDKVEYPVQLESESYVGVGQSMAAGVDFLLKEFKAIRSEPKETDPLNYFQDPCCPSCPAILVGTVTPMAKTATFFDWTESSDLDDIVAVDVGGNLTFRTSGLYSVHLNWELSFPVTATGWTNWRIMSFASNDDGNSGSQYVLSAANSGGNMHIGVNIFQWAHLFADGESYNAGWEVDVEQTAGMVTGASGILSNCGLVIIRHGDGCAREAGSA